MKLKVDDKGQAVVQDGKPVYVHDDGKEIAFDAVGTVATIARLNSEAKAHRERAERAEASYEPYKTISDPAAALKALETVGNLDAKKLVDAGQVEVVRNEAIKATEEKWRPHKKRADELEAELYNERIGGSFARSKFISEKIAIPPDMVLARFGTQFKTEDRKIVAFDLTGNKLFSRSRPGELADFEEAIEMIVEQYPYKDHILKGNGATGSGVKSSAAVVGGGKTITRTAFDALPQHERAAVVKEGAKVVD